MLSDFQVLHFVVIYLNYSDALGSVPLQRLPSFYYGSQKIYLSLILAVLFFNATLELQKYLCRLLVEEWNFRNLNINYYWG